VQTLRLTLISTKSYYSWIINEGNTIEIISVADICKSERDSSSFAFNFNLDFLGQTVSYLPNYSKTSTYTSLDSIHLYNIRVRSVWDLQTQAVGDSDANMYKWMFYYNFDDRKQFGQKIQVKVECKWGRIYCRFTDVCYAYDFYWISLINYSWIW